MPLPTDATQSAVSSAPSESTKVASQSTSDSLSGSSVAAPPAAGGLPSGGGAATPQQEWAGIRDAARNYGVDLSGYQNDHEALAALAQWYGQMPQYQQLAAYGQEYIRQQQSQQQQPQQPAQPQDWWQAPATESEVRSLVSQYYTKDPISGELRPKVNTPISVIQKVDSYTSHMQDYENTLLRNPQAAKEKIAELARNEATKIAQQMFQQQHAHQESRDIIARHSHWLYYRDPQTGQPNGTLTPDGQMFQWHVNQAQANGMRSSAAQEAYAIAQMKAQKFDQMLAAQRQRQQMQPQYQQPGQPPQTVQRQPNYNPPPQQAAIPNGPGGLAASLREATKGLIPDSWNN